jgi:hypothetical protein
MLEFEDAILAFANQFGVLGVSSEDYRAARNLPWYADELRALRKTSPPMSEIVNPYFGGINPVAEAESLAEFRFAARALRDLRTAYDCIRDRTWETMAWTSLGSALARSEHCELEIGPGVAEVTPRADPARTLVRFFERTVTAGLEAFHPSIALQDPGTKRPAHGWMAAATVSLYSTCCLELYNHIAENATYRSVRTTAAAACSFVRRDVGRLDRFPFWFWRRSRLPGPSRRSSR